MTVQELIDLVNGNEFWALWYVPDRACELIAETINTVSRDWWATSVNVYSCEDGFVGVRGVSWIDSGRSVTPRQLGVKCRAEQYVMKLAPVYVPKREAV